jgi:L-ribulose-5-phosphate 3-epimerase
MSGSQIGFMQGRLSPIVDGKIQAFPWNNWRQEFSAARDIGLRVMEWTLDQDNLYENPIMTSVGQKEIIKLCKDFEITIPSLTGDCFMQSPFWKLPGSEKIDRQIDLMNIVDACSRVGISKIVIPLVDDGRIDNNDQSLALFNFLNDKEPYISNMNIQIVFESDFSPSNLKLFIKEFNSKTFGINYDIGNSASLGFNVDEEFNAYGDRILNVHIKDRLLNGKTVPLGEGCADFEKVFYQLSKIGYEGNYILQTARSINEKHANVLNSYKSLTEKWISKYES